MTTGCNFNTKYLVGLRLKFRTKESMAVVSHYLLRFALDSKITANMDKNNTLVEAVGEYSESSKVIQQILSFLKDYNKSIAAEVGLTTNDALEPAIKIEEIFHDTSEECEGCQ